MVYIIHYRTFYNMAMNILDIYNFVITKYIKHNIYSIYFNIRIIHRNLMLYD